MSFKNAICLSLTVRMFVVLIGFGLVFFRCIKSVETSVIGDPMVFAVSMGQPDKVTQLLKNGYDVNAVDDDSNSALSFAVWNVDYHASREVLEILLAHQVNVRYKNDFGQTALHNVVKITNQEMRMRIVGKLVKFGADINESDDKGYTVLEKNIESYDTIGTDMMLDWWGKIISPAAYENAKKRAREYDARDLLVVLDKGPRSIRQGAGWNPGLIDTRTGLNDLHVAVINGDTQLVDTILKRNVSVDAQSQDEYGMRPLHYAVVHRNTKMITLLIERKAGVNSVNKSLCTPLHMVAWLNDVDLAKKSADALLAAGANINARDKDGNTLLHMLVNNNNKDLIQYLGSKYDWNGEIKNGNHETVGALAQRLNRKNLLGV